MKKTNTKPTVINHPTKDAAKNLNVVDLVCDPSKSDDERRLGIKVAVNAVTSQIVSNSLALARKKTELLPEEPTLDLRNEQDINAEPRAVPYGFEEPVDRAKLLNQLVTLRADLIKEYDPLIRFAEINMVQNKFDLLLTPAQFLEFRIKTAGEVNINAIKRGVEMFNEPEDLVRQIMIEDARKQKANLVALKDETLDIMNDAIESSSDSGEPSAIFDSLIDDVKIAIKDRIADKINAEYQRLFPIVLRTGNLEMSSLMTLYKAMFEEIKAL